MIDPEIISPFAFRLDGGEELRAQENVNNLVMLSNGKIGMEKNSRQSGVFARKFYNGVYGASSVPELGERQIRNVLDEAGKAALELYPYAERHFGLRPLEPLDEMPAISGVPASHACIVDRARELDAALASKFPNVPGRMIMLAENYVDTVFAAGGSVRFRRVFRRTTSMLRFIAPDKDGTPVSVIDIGSRGSFLCDADLSTESVLARAEALYERLKYKQEAVYPVAGEHQIIMSGRLSGLLAHEAMGHTTESDFVFGGSVARRMLGREVASGLVSMVDFAGSAFGKETPLPIYVDDEGVRGRDAELIKDGVLTGYMTDRAGAELLGVECTGNARAAEYSDEPLPRMRNTCILPGRDREEDMIASVDDGYYLSFWNNGQADMNSEFMFGVTEGYEIKNGRLGRAIKDTTLCGTAVEMLKTVDMVGDRVEWDLSGSCGKKQSMPNAMGGPALRCRAVLGGV